MNKYLYIIKNFKTKPWIKYWLLSKNGIKEIIEKITGIPPLILLKSLGKNLINYLIYGNSVQDGTPTPSNPIEIESVGDLITDLNDTNYGKYKIPVIVRGKNRLSFNGRSNLITKNGTLQGVTFTSNSNGSITMNGTFSGATKQFITLCTDNEFTEKTYCRLSGCVGGSLNSYYFQTYNGYRDTGDGVTIDNSSDLNIINLILEPGAILNNVTIYPQLELGTESSTYEPYIEPTTTNIYLDEPLRKVGDYADYIDFQNQKIYRNIGVYNVNGTETILPYSSTTIYFLSNALPNAKYSTDINVLCNYYKGKTSGGGSSHHTGEIWLQSEPNYPRCYFGTDFASSTDFKSFLNTKYNSGVPVKLIYPLENIIQKDITLPNIPTIKGTTIFEIDTTINPSNMEVDYLRR